MTSKTLVWTISTDQIPAPKQDPTYFEKLLRRRSAVFSTQLMGYCPFSVDSKNRMRFEWLGIPTGMLAFHMLIVSLMGQLYYAYSDKFDAIVGKSADTDQLGYELNGIVTSYGQLSIRVLSIVYRHEICDLWNALNTGCKEIYEFGPEKYKIKFEEQLRRSTLKLDIVAGISFLVCFINGYGFSTFGFGENKIFQVLPTYLGIIFIIALSLWNTYGILLITKVLWYVHFMDLIAIGFSELSHQRHRHSFLKQYKWFEDVAAKFNSAFSIELTITVVGLGIFFLNVIYSACIAFKYKPGDGGLEYTAVTMIIHGSALFMLCCSASQISLKAKRTAILFHNEQLSTEILDCQEVTLIQSFLTKAIHMSPVIQPGNFFTLNRQLLTSLLGAILTYIFVLLQFRVEEDKSGKNSTNRPI